MWFAQFLRRIEKSESIQKRIKLLADDGEPARIYVENVRSFFGVPFRVAELILEAGVRQGVFERCEALLCPHDERVIFETCGEDEEKPQAIPCEVCEAMEIEPNSFAPNECRAMPFYRLAHANAS